MSKVKSKTPSPTIRGRLERAEERLQQARSDIQVILQGQEAGPDTKSHLRGTTTTIGLAIDRVRDALVAEEQADAREKGR